MSDNTQNPKREARIKELILKIENNRKWYDISAINSAPGEYAPMLRIMAQTRLFFINRHDVFANHWYSEKDNLRYSFHLELVDVIFRQLYTKYSINQLKAGKLDFNKLAIYIAIVYGHDATEDTRMTFNDIVTQLGILGYSKEATNFISEGIYALEDYKGKNRNERKPLEYYKNIDKEIIYIMTKMSDIVANTLFTKAEEKDITGKLVDFEKLLSLVDEYNLYLLKDVIHFVYNEYFGKQFTYDFSDLERSLFNISEMVEKNTKLQE